MRSVGIICEYNPFHNGHLYHLKKTKELYKDSVVILIMSGNFTQRGDVSVINKWDKTRLALLYGVDLVIELPFIFASQSADIFASSSVYLLDKLKVNNLVFGSESNDIKLLNKMADIQINNKEYDKLVKKYLDTGINYPTALSRSLKDITKKEIKSPNDILGLSYIREIKKLNSDIIPITIKRTNDYNSKELDSNIVSATSIRSALKNNINIKEYVPNDEYIKKIFIDDYYNLLKYKILTEDDLSIYQTVDEGLSERIKNNIIKSNTLEELINNIKTKRYTYNKLSRMFLHILCNFTKKEANKYKLPEYIRVLGFSKLGQKYLNKIKKEIDIPLITKFSDIKNEILDIEFRSTCVYSSIFPNSKETIESEYKNSPIKKD